VALMSLLLLFHRPRPGAAGAVDVEAAQMGQGDVPRAQMTGGGQ
jgi:hypothetical protein